MTRSIIHTEEGRFISIFYAKVIYDPSGFEVPYRSWALIIVEEVYSVFFLSRNFEFHRRPSASVPCHFL